eukprot:jgi/Botrbrau1/943/Bobra.0167s0053.1
MLTDKTNIQMQGAGAEPAMKRQKADRLVASANEALSFCLLDPSDECSLNIIHRFHPEMSHQLFGDEEEISGYVDIGVDITLSQITFETCISVNCSRRFPGATDIYESLAPHFPQGFAKEKLEFTRALSSRTTAFSLSELGPPLTSALGKDGLRISVYKSTLESASPAVKELHNRLQPLLLFFIDAASLIDPNDEGWDLLLAVKTLAGGQQIIVGLATVYHLLGFPDSKRLRLAQLFVLPPYQRQGIGQRLMQAVYVLGDSSGARDVTYEDPTDDVKRLRERVEVDRALEIERLCTLAATKAAAALAVLAARQEGTAGEGSVQDDDADVALALRLSAAEVEEARGLLRVPKTQVHKVWEVLLAMQKGLGKGEGARPALEQLLRKRLAGSAASTEQAALRKMFITTSDGFAMVKGQREGEQAPAFQMEGDQAASETPAEREARIAAEVRARLDELDTLTDFGRSVVAARQQP